MFFSASEPLHKEAAMKSYLRGIRNALREVRDAFGKCREVFGNIGGTLVFSSVVVAVIVFTADIIVRGLLEMLLVLLKKTTGAVLGLAGFAVLISPFGAMAGAAIGLSFFGLFFGTMIFQYNSIVVQILIMLPFVLASMTAGAYVGGVLGGFLVGGVMWLCGKRNFRDN